MQTLMAIIVNLRMVVFGSVFHRVVEIVQRIRPVNNNRNQPRIRDLSFSVVSIDLLVDRPQLILTIRAQLHHPMLGISYRKHYRRILGKVQHGILNSKLNCIQEVMRILLKLTMKIRRRVILVSTQDRSYPFLFADALGDNYEPEEPPAYYQEEHHNYQKPHKKRGLSVSIVLSFFNIYI